MSRVSYNLAKYFLSYFKIRLKTFSFTSSCDFWAFCWHKNHNLFRTKDSSYVMMNSNYLDFKCFFLVLVVYNMFLCKSLNFLIFKTLTTELVRLFVAFAFTSINKVWFLIGRWGLGFHPLRIVNISFTSLLSFFIRIQKIEIEDKLRKFRSRR